MYDTMVIKLKEVINHRSPMQMRSSPKRAPLASYVPTHYLHTLLLCRASFKLSKMRACLQHERCSVRYLTIVHPSVMPLCFASTTQINASIMPGVDK